MRGPVEHGAPRVVAIDGPAGSGKSTVARALARRLGFAYVDTGAMYRTLTWLLLREGVDHTDESAVAHFLDGLAVEWEFRDGAVVMSVPGAEPGDAIRRREVTGTVSAVAAQRAVRAWMVERQRALVRSGPLVMEGRDIGSVVFPDAAWKVYLDAAPRVRARRRLAELGEAGSELERMESEIERRDALDRGRGVSPLRVPPGARVVDTSGLSVEQVVEELERWVRT